MMSPDALLCPHCGVRQSDRAWVDDVGAPTPSPAGPLRVSSDEARALIQTRGAAALDYSPRGPMALVLPSAESGWIRTAEWVLTGMAAPLLLVGFVGILVRWRLFAHVRAGREATVTVVFGLFGGVGLLSLAGAAGWQASSSLGLVGLCFGALLLRLWLRWRSTRITTGDGT